jgi:hypothetical protein
VKNTLNLALFFSLFCGCNPSMSGINGELSGSAADFIERGVSPILIKAKLCSSVQDCIRHEFIQYAVGSSIHYYVYGIADEKIIKEILISMLNSELKISSITFWHSKHQDKSFFERSVVNFTNQTGDK